MPSAKVAITIDKALLEELDQMVGQHVFPNRSQAIQEALREKLARTRRQRLAEECAKLDPQVERTMAEEGMGLEIETWPEY